MKNILKSGLLFLLAIMTTNIYSQNLISNGSFEDLTTCPSTEGLLNNARGWRNVSNGSYLYGTPDLFNSCTHTGVNVPNNARGYQFAKTGNGYVGIVAYSCVTTEREYFYNVLTAPLVAGKKYKLKYYVNLADRNSAYAINSLGAYFSRGPVQWNSIQNAPLTPQVTSDSNIFLADTAKWMLIEGDYLASGGERYITFGNFNTDQKTLKVQVNTPDLCGSYYFYDDVSLYEYTDPLIPAEAGGVSSICIGEQTQIGSPATTNYKYRWQPADGLEDTTTAQPLVNPKHTTTYYLTQWDYMENETRDSVTVFVDDCIDELKIPNAFTPNNDGYNDKFVIQNAEGWHISITIYDRWGNKVYESFEYNNTWNGCELPAGVYYYIIHATAIEGRTTDKMGSIELIR